VRSALAEEGVLRLVLTEPALFDKLGALTPERFSSALLGRAYAALKNLYAQGLTPSLSLLEPDFTPDELAHLTAVAQRDTVVSEDELDDYVATILQESGLSQSKKDKDVKQMWEQLKQTKGYGG
jgi:DNA primase